MQTPNIKRTSCSMTLLALLVGCSTQSGDSIKVGAAKIKDKAQPVIAQSVGEKGLPVTATTVGTATQADAAAAAARTPVVAKRANAPWIGSRTVPVLSDSSLPPVFNETFALDFDGYGNKIPLAMVAERLTRMSGIPVRVKQDVYGTKQDGARPIAVPQAVPVAVGQSPQVGAPIPIKGGAVAPGASGVLQPAFSGNMTQSFGMNSSTDMDAVSMKWKGSLAGYLDHVTGLLNLSWSYRDGVVVIERFISESFEISAFGGTQDYKMGIAGGNESSSGGGFGAASASLDVKESGKLAILDSLKKTVETIVLPTGGTVTLNEGSGRFTVSAPKDVLAKVRDLLQHEDAALRRQAIVQFDIYSVTNKSNDEYGVDWTGFLTELMKTWNGTLKAPASLVSTSAAAMRYTLSATPDENVAQSFKNTAARYGGSTALLQALHQLGDSAQYKPISLIASNRQWARKTNLRNTGYVSETTPSTSSAAGSGAPGLKTSTVTSGDKILVQPAIMDDGTIYVRFGVSLTDLVGLFDVSAGEGATLQRVQTPETSGTDDQGTIRLNPGEAMVITGLSRRVATSDRNALGEDVPFIAGGSQKRSLRREDFLIVVRATPL